MHLKISRVTGPEFTKFVAVVIFSSKVLTQQSALRSVHALSNDRGDILKKKVTSVKHKPVDGIAMLGGLMNIRNTFKFIQLLITYCLVVALRTEFAMQSTGDWTQETLTEYTRQEVTAMKTRQKHHCICSVIQWWPLSLCQRFLLPLLQSWEH